MTTSGVVTKKSGTSFAAPIVTGVIAQMMEAKEGLKSSPKKVKSILLASADYHKINPDRVQTKYWYCIDDNVVGNFLMMLQLYPNMMPSLLPLVPSSYL